ncbi:MAG: 50S ribosomal protein L24 [bacterium]
MSKIKLGDEVVVISGKDKEKRGKVIQKIPRENKLVVEKVNITKRHIRPTRRGQESGIIERETPIFTSKVMLICPRCGKTTRIGVKVLRKSPGEKEKLRFCKKCGEVID